MIKTARFRVLLRAAAIFAAAKILAALLHCVRCGGYRNLRGGAPAATKHGTGLQSHWKCHWRKPELDWHALRRGDGV